ncbi:MAG: phosphodiesterase [Gammaproteobacteria bacterium]
MKANYHRFLSDLCLLPLATVIGVLLASPSEAEVIHIPVGQQAPENRDLPRPTRGMSQDKVLAEFGEPLSLTSPVGDPPISKWEYADFTVYFESATVIHSVLRHKRKFPVQTPQP